MQAMRDFEFFMAIRSGLFNMFRDPPNGISTQLCCVAINAVFCFGRSNFEKCFAA